MNDRDGPVVVGAGGFLGSHLVRRLEGEGRSPQRYGRRRPVVRDGRLDEPALSSRTFYYLATRVNPGSAERHPGWSAADESDFAEFLGAVSTLPDRPRVLLASSSINYARAAAPPYREDTELVPDHAYGASKLRMERMLLDRADRVRPVILRLASLYGPGQRTDPGHGVIAHWLRAAARDEPLVLIGDQSVVRDFVYVADVVDALLRIARTDDPPEVLNLGSGRPVSLDELFTTVCSVVGRVLRHESRPGRTFDRPSLWIDVSLARSVIGWVPGTGLDLGLARTWSA